MAVTPESEQPRAPESEGFSDAVTFAFGDPAAGVSGVARVGRSSTAGGQPQASGRAILFAGNEAAAVRAAGGIEVASRDWGLGEAGGLRTTTESPLEAWTVTFA